MKHLEEFRKIVNQPFDYARQLKKISGKKIVGYVCSYVPEDILKSAKAHASEINTGE
jgi:benzoyl-CoA reductase/2-hydroxyglutaryl-CoA dehydratase subunit BcrC/BadD/HgdB